MTHNNIQIFGRVHGVHFRYYTKQMADSLGITGFVKNLPDGSVFIEAEGENHWLQNFIDWCRQGPSGAHVMNIKITESKIKNFSDFRIIY